MRCEKDRVFIAVSIILPLLDSR